MQVPPARLRGLVRRYRVDRRLPPPVRALFLDTLRLRQADRVARRKAEVLPVLGADAVFGSPSVGRWRDRRLVTSGALDAPTDDTALRTAHAVCDVVVAAGLRPFVIDRRRDRVVLGLPLGDRSRALQALGERLVAPGWFMRWEDRGGSGVTTLDRPTPRRRVIQARTLSVFRSFQVGDRATGDELGVVLTFWEIGTSGQLELVGTRGHERFDPRSPATVECFGGHRFPGRAAFPVAANLERLAQPVDVVYTWVDGSDPQWRDAFRRTAAEQCRSVDDDALDPARYRSRDELRYSLRSLWMYCGWVRHVYIVTAGQRPEWLVSHDRITIVDHADILPSDALPTFNSHAIESALHRIDGLAEHFVYFNDDMFVGRSLRPEDFFTPNGLARVFQSGARVPGFEDDATLAVDTAARRGRELLIERFGRAVTHKPLHSPYPLRRSVLADIDREFVDVVAATAHSRFRSPSDLSIAASFGQHYGIATERAVFGEIATEYVHVESERLDWHLDRIRLADDIDTYCINETQDRLSAADRDARIQAFMSEVLPIPAPWEQI